MMRTGKLVKLSDCVGSKVLFGLNASNLLFVLLVIALVLFLRAMSFFTKISLALHVFSGYMHTEIFFQDIVSMKKCASPFS